MFVILEAVRVPYLLLLIYVFLFLFVVAQAQQIGQLNSGTLKPLS